METFILNCVSAQCWIPLVVLLTVLEITITFYIITILHTVAEDIPVVWQWQLINNVIICPRRASIISQLWKSCSMFIWVWRYFCLWSQVWVSKYKIVCDWWHRTLSTHHIWGQFGYCLQLILECMQFFKVVFVGDSNKWLRLPPSKIFLSSEVSARKCSHNFQLFQLNCATKSSI